MNLDVATFWLTFENGHWLYFGQDPGDHRLNYLFVDGRRVRLPEGAESWQKAIVLADGRIAALCDMIQTRLPAFHGQRPERAQQLFVNGQSVGDPCSSFHLWEDDGAVWHTSDDHVFRDGVMRGMCGKNMTRSHSGVIFTCSHDRGVVIITVGRETMEFDEVGKINFGTDCVTYVAVTEEGYVERYTFEMSQYVTA